MPSGERLAMAQDLGLQARDAHHEELVEVRWRHDAQELQPLEQRHVVGDSASASTRALNSSHDSSRLM
jgi:hypothetical protein